MLRLASGRSDSKCILIYYYTHCKYSPGVCTINTEQGCVYICKEITQRTSCERLDFEGRIDASIGFGAEQKIFFNLVNTRNVQRQGECVYIYVYIYQNVPPASVLTLRMELMLRLASGRSKANIF